MKLAHVRERHAPHGTPYRLAAALDDAAGTWLDLERARRRLAAADPARTHNAVLYRTPIGTLDAHLATGSRIEALGELLEGFEPADDVDEAVLSAADLVFGAPILRPAAFRDFYAFEGHVATMWSRRGGEIPEAWYRLPVFYFSNVSEMRGPGEPVWAPAGSTELDFELEVGAIVDTPVRDLAAGRAEEAIGGYTILNDWSARDLQREETAVRLGPAKGKDFATTIGPWIVTPDELASARAPDSTGPDLAMTAEVRTGDGRVVAVSRGSWASAHFSFDRMLERASADVRIRPGELVGSGTVGGGLPARSPGGDAWPVPRPGRRGRPPDRSPRRAPDADRGAARMTGDPRPGYPPATLPDAETGTTIRIDRMRPGHWPAVRAIYESGIAGGDATLERAAPDWPAWDAAHRPEGRFVAVDREHVLGWVALAPVSTRRVYDGVAWISVYVSPASQRRGIGRTLLLAAVEASEEAGIWTLQAGILAENAASLAVHRRVGFRRVGVQRADRPRRPRSVARRRPARAPERVRRPLTRLSGIWVVETWTPRKISATMLTKLTKTTNPTTTPGNRPPSCSRIPASGRRRSRRTGRGVPGGSHRCATETSSTMIQTKAIRFAVVARPARSPAR